MSKRAARRARRKLEIRLATHPDDSPPGAYRKPGSLNPKKQK